EAERAKQGLPARILAKVNSLQDPDIIKALYRASKTGDEIKVGDVLMVTEAMKMETNIKAKSDGKVVEVKFKEGEKVEKQDLVIVVG
ncbi:MAG: biotin/lipoyl-containing protein, partial [Deltaproteobacteria bacterium]